MFIFDYNPTSLISCIVVCVQGGTLYYFIFFVHMGFSIKFATPYLNIYNSFELKTKSFLLLF